ncbi:MAG: hypothetical protein U9Q82_05955 [Chloroflexota bacterium]|nr:hypothetical protein [Chloroflexota bacterium]
MTNIVNLAIKKLKAGDKAAAKELLIKALKQNPKNADAWYVMAAVVTDTEQRTECLQRALQIDPQHEKARRTLSKMTGKSTNLPIKKKPGHSNAINLSEILSFVSQHKKLIGIVTVVFGCLICFVVGSVIKEFSNFNALPPTSTSSLPLSPSTVMTITQTLTTQPTVKKLTSTPTITRTPYLSSTLPPSMTPYIVVTQNTVSCTCADDTYNCDDFINEPFTAQECFEHCKSQGYGDVHGLDGNNNNSACEDY